MSFLLLTDRLALLLDAGSGVSRLAEPALRERIAGHEDLHIILSHYHLDHVIGLSYLPAVWPRGRIRLYGPGRPLVDAEPQEALHRLLSPPLFSARYEAFPAPIEVTAIREATFTLGDLPVTVWRQRHPGGSAGIRVGDEVAYLTDTGVDPASLDRVRGVRLLLHELWLSDEEAEQAGRAGHSWFGAVAEFVRAAKPARFMAVHHHPSRSEAQIREWSAHIEQIAGVPVLTPAEGEAVELSRQDQNYNYST